MSTSFRFIHHLAFDVEHVNKFSGHVTTSTSHKVINCRRKCTVLVTFANKIEEKVILKDFFFMRMISILKETIEF